MTFDALIIGAGQAASPLCHVLSKMGKRVALAEGEHLGGSCVNYGCTPSKTIIASARVAYLARRGADFGVGTGDVTIDFETVMGRADDMVHRFRESNRRTVEKAGVTLFKQYASFEDAHHVRVGEEIIEAEHIYINTGTKSVTPPIEGLDSVEYLDEHSILKLKALPEHLIVLGGGYIGIEYAQAFRRLGSQVTIIDRGAHLMHQEDADIAEWAHRILKHEGMHILFNATILGVTQGKQVHVAIERAGQKHTVSGSHVLVATGRAPNTDKLVPQNAGITLDARGFIPVDDHLQTNVPNIWALGDVNGHGAFTHTSYDDFRIVQDNLKGGTMGWSHRIPTYGVFIDPPLGRVGMTERQVRASGKNALMATMQMREVGRALEADETQGMMKLLVDADTKLILGAAVFGLNGDEVIHTITTLMYAKAPYTVLQEAVHIHPTVAELLPTMAQTKLKPLV